VIAPAKEQLAALAIFIGISVAFFGFPVLGDMSHSYVGFDHPDPASFMWFLSWWPHAIAHGLDPFVTHVVWAPSGFDLGWTAAVPAAAVVAAPITATLGPVVAYNALLLLAPALSSWTAFLMCRYLTRRFAPSLIGGYVFGYSTYELGQMLNHLNLVLTFVVPLVVLLILLKINNDLSDRRFVCLFAGAVILQFLLYAEVLLTALFVAAIAVLAGYLMESPTRRVRILETARSALAATALAGLVVSPYLYHAFANGQAGTAVHKASANSIDLLNFVLPTAITLVGKHVGFANAAEPVGYVGVPLFLIVLSFAVTRWREPGTRLLILMLSILCFLCLGPVLHVADHDVISLPWQLLTRVPVMNSVLPARLMLYVFLITGLILALWLQRGTQLATPAKYGLAAVVIVSLLPNLTSPVSWWHTRTAEPKFFATAAYKRVVAPNATVVVIPYGPCGRSMLWQAESDMYYKMAGGYVGAIPPAFAHLAIVRSLFSGQLIPDYRALMKDFIIDHDVRAVFVVDGTPGEWSRLFAGMSRPELVEGVWVYYVPKHWRTASVNRTSASTDYAGGPAPSCKRGAGLARG
jgi:hypothetical protein